jgi:hypothetical protein
MYQSGKISDSGMHPNLNTATTQICEIVSLKIIEIPASVPLRENFPSERLNPSISEGKDTPRYHNPDKVNRPDTM